MMNVNLEKLSELAEKSSDLGYSVPEAWVKDRNYPDSEVAWLEFVGEATPEVVLSLLAEIDRLTKFNKAYSETITSFNKIIKFEKEYADSLRKDADRYRWLRDTKNWDEESNKIKDIDLRFRSFIAYSSDDVENESGEELDRIVDLLMSNQKEKTE